MDRDTFEAALQSDGYTCREGSIEPHAHRPAHTHEYDVQLLVLDGAITLVFGSERHSYGPGDLCTVPAGTVHEEHTGADGVRYLIGRRLATHKQSRS